MTQQISPERKGMYSFGLVLQIIGGCLFAIPFIAILVTMIGAAGGGDPNIAAVPIAFAFGLVGFVLIGAGAAMRNIAARGVAGSGLVLDPEQAREEMEPWTRMGGGMVKDALDEADINLNNLGVGSQPEKIIMIKCRQCSKLNEEDSKYCQECGRPM